MSYNSGYNQYSPYFQHQTPGQTSQDSTGSAQQHQSHGLETFQHNSYQQQQSCSSVVTSADQQTPSHSTQRYSEASGAGQYQGSRGSYGYSTDEFGTSRPAIDTTALGSLAYASSLGQNSRDSSSLQQIIDYNRQRAREGYSYPPAYNAGTSITNGSSYTQQRSDGRGSITQKDDLAQRNPISDHSQYNTGYHDSTPNYKSLSQVPKASQAIQLPHDQLFQPGNEKGKNIRQEHHSQRPSSPFGGQDQRKRPPDQFPSAPSSYYTTTPTNGLAAPKSDHSKVPTDSALSKSSQDKLNQAPHTSQEVIQQSPSTGLSSRQLVSGIVSITAESRSPDGQHAIGHHGLPNLNPNGASQQSSTLNETPMTVDPNQVFNQIEYQRRQAAVAKEKEEAEKAAKAVATPVQFRKGEATIKEQQMAEEMRLMIEKMREYKAEDPSLFTSIWEQVKRGQPPGSTPSIIPKDAGATGQGQQSGTLNPVQILSPSPTVNQATGAQQGPLNDSGQNSTLNAQLRSGTKRKSVTGDNRENAAHNHEPGFSPSVNPQVVTASNSLAQDTVQSSHKTNDGQVNKASKSPQMIYVSGVGPLLNEQTSGQTGTPRQGNGIQSARTEASTQISSYGEVSKTNGTAWPEHKKWDLAVAAEKILHSIPINANKKISPEDILGFLNQNPSYEQLCRLIEGKGLIIDRGYFARSVLEAVPGLGVGVKNRVSSTNHPAHSPTAPAGVSNGQPRPKTISQNDHLANGHQAPGDMHKVENGSRKPSIAQMTPTRTQHPSSSHNAALKADKKQLDQTSAEGQPAVALSKQEKARKRTIAEIVDLSQLSDDDIPPTPGVQSHDKPAEAQSLAQQQQLPPPPPPPSSYPGPPAGVSFSQFAYTPPVQNGSSSQFSRPIPDQGPYSSYSFYPAQPIFQPFPQPPPAEAERLISKSHPRRALLRSKDIVRPLKNVETTRRTRYNPKYIVAAVLRANGKHPTMQPLNHHLEGLKKNFKYVTDVSDLSTFRWDLVDPGGDPAAFGLLSHTETHTSSEGPDYSLRATSGNPVKDSPAVGVPSPLIDDSLQNTEPSITTPTHTYPTHKVSSTDATTTPSAKPAPATTTASSGPSLKRRGRPPGAKNKMPSKSRIKQNDVISSHEPRQREKSFNTAKSKQKTTTPVPRSAINPSPVRPDTPGIANTSISSNIAIVIPSPSHSTVSVTNSLKPSSFKRPRSETNSDISGQHQCFWKGGCRSDFLDLGSLKTHMMTHRRSTKPFPCRWKGCGIKDTRDGYDEFLPQVFGTEAEWEEHVIQRHWLSLFKMNEVHEYRDERAKDRRRAENTVNRVRKRTKAEALEIQDDKMEDLL